ncbi:hypothetical protein IKE99_00985 [Candidatus Saccharibacteria bacterium]|nr:hypothetical protein [Candidatus Saccharibacteria bacterium]
MWAKIIRNNLKSNLRLNLNLSYILYILSTITIIYLSILFQLANNAFALTYSNESNIDFTINPTIGITLSSSNLTIDNLAPGSYADSNIITISVNSNASHGYYLSATAGDSNTTSASHNTNLTNIANDNYTFTSLTSNQATLSSFSDNSWGYSYCLTTNDCTTNSNWISGSSGSTTAGYNGLPLDNGDNGTTGVTLINTTNPTVNHSAQFKIGAKASNTQPAGTYTNTINFYAITNQTPISFNDAFAIEGKERLLGYYKMQDTTPSICNAVTENQVGTLIDIRDNQTYKVAKLKDGKCWMVENLKIGKTLTESGDSITLTPANSNINDNYTLNFSDIPADGKFHAYTIDNIPDQNNSTEYYCTGNDTTNDWESCYYNWYTATAGAGTTSSSYGTNVETSICPASWTIPTVQQFSGLHTQYNSPALILVDDPTTTKENSAGKIPGFLLSGEYRTTGALYRGYFGGYWSRIAYDAQTAFNMGVYTFSADVIGHTSKYYGFAVRCLAK